AKDVRDIAEKHVGPLDRGKSLVESFRDGFFHEALFQTDTKLARGNLNEVLGLHGGKALECVCEESLLCGSAALLGKRGIDFGDLREAKRRPHGMIAQDFFSAGSQITVMAKHGGKLSGILFCNASHRAEKN